MPPSRRRNSRPRPDVRAGRYRELDTVTQDLQPPGMRPAFATPKMMTLPPPDLPSQPPAPAMEQSPSQDPPKRGRGRPRRQTESADTPTPTSSPGSRPVVHDPVTGREIPPVVLPSPAEFEAILRADELAAKKAAKADLPKLDGKLAVRAGVVGIGIVAMVAGWAIRRSTRGQATLRRPDKDEANAIAKPIADILGRHVTKGEDLADFFSFGEALIAVDEYLSNGPLLKPAINPGQMPKFEEHQ